MLCSQRSVLVGVRPRVVGGRFEYATNTSALGISSEKLLGRDEHALTTGARFPRLPATSNPGSPLEHARLHTSRKSIHGLYAKSLLGVEGGVVRLNLRLGLPVPLLCRERDEEGSGATASGVSGQDGTVDAPLAIAAKLPTEYIHTLQGRRGNVRVRQGAVHCGRMLRQVTAPGRGVRAPSTPCQRQPRVPTRWQSPSPRKPWRLSVGTPTQKAMCQTENPPVVVSSVGRAVYRREKACDFFF